MPPACSIAAPCGSGRLQLKQYSISRVYCVTGGRLCGLPACPLSGAQGERERERDKEMSTTHSEHTHTHTHSSSSSACSISSNSVTSRRILRFNRYSRTCRRHFEGNAVPIVKMIKNAKNAIDCRILDIISQKKFKGWYPRRPGHTQKRPRCLVPDPNIRLASQRSHCYCLTKRPLRTIATDPRASSKQRSSWPFICLLRRP